MKKAMTLFFAIILFSITGQAQSDQSSSVKSQIEKQSEMMKETLKNGDFEKFGSFFAEDAMMKLSGHNPMSGRSAIVEAHKPMAENGMKLMVNTEEVMDFGEYAYEIGSYEIHSQDGQKVDHGYYGTLWKNNDGNWQIYRDVISSSSGAGEH